MKKKEKQNEKLHERLLVYGFSEQFEISVVDIFDSNAALRRKPDILSINYCFSFKPQLSFPYLQKRHLLNFSFY